MQAPQIDDVDAQTGKPKYATFAEYQDARDKWNRAETLREFQQQLAKTHQSGADSSGAGWAAALAGYAFLALLAYAGWVGISWAGDALKAHSTAKASAPDQRDEQIKELSAHIAQLEAKPAEHHYELREDGIRTFRFDPVTGDTCIQLTTKEDWKRPDTIRQGCQYQDWVNSSGATYKDRLAAECALVNVKSACDQMTKQ